MYSIIQVKAAIEKVYKGETARDVLILMRDGKVIAIRSFKEGGDIFAAAGLLKLIITDDQVTDLVIYCDNTYEIFDYDRENPLDFEGVDITFFRETANSYNRGV